MIRTNGLFLNINLQPPRDLTGVLRKWVCVVSTGWPLRSILQTNVMLFYKAFKPIRPMWQMGLGALAVLLLVQLLRHHALMLCLLRGQNDWTAAAASDEHTALSAFAFAEINALLVSSFPVSSCLICEKKLFNFCTHFTSEQLLFGNWVVVQQQQQQQLGCSV